MIASKKGLILRELQEGTGAAIAAATDHAGLRSGLRIWFDDLDDRHGPVAELRPYGLKGHRVELYFGNFSGAVIDQIKRASPEDVQLARALISSIRSGVDVEVPGQAILDWSVTSGAFSMVAKVRDLESPGDDSSVIATCHDVIVPMMAAMAELIGYDVIEQEVDQGTLAYEGAVSAATVRRRERNPRNRLLCIRIHGERCAVCGMEPRVRYGDAGGIIEVHHLEPVASLVAPRAYDPRTDLVPLCPSCHRAIHTRRPIPFSTEELRSLIRTGGPGG